MEQVIFNSLFSKLIDIQKINCGVADRTKLYGKPIHVHFYTGDYFFRTIRTKPS